MRFSKKVRYGRFLMGAAVLLSLLACERKRPRTIEEVVAAAKTVRPADSPVATSAPVVPLITREPDIEVPRREVLDSLGPVRLDSRLVDINEWLDTTEWRYSARSEVVVDTLLQNFVQVRAHGEAPRLLYRASSTARQWREVSLDFPDLYDGQLRDAVFTLDTANLDHWGAPELLINIRWSRYGNRLGSSYRRAVVLDVTRTPLLLLNALVEEGDEQFGRNDVDFNRPYQELAAGLRKHDWTQEKYAGCTRSIKLKRDIELEPIRHIGSNDNCYEMTPLPAGSYRYQHGKVFRVGK
ncbi:hypothetical protein KB206_06330 [Microvirga sp. STS02]|uniref:hypothetical protein n=1 Tax=Hymenobacter negativus TaxID=2795026 RepID=UPI0018DE9121|nr:MULTISPECIES: hypothetical protein [Bacteria]MBH8568489.1 hypothetical protein [Hymenobacter negativus]MBR7208223.1 hypothetical protein [Microvirga sp. STS02]